MLEARRFQANARMGVMVVVLMTILAVFMPLAASAKAANTIKVSPVRSDVQIAAGESKEIPISITNLTKEEVKVSVGQNDFVAGDERGSPALILDETKYASTHSLKRFMQPIPDVTIPAEQVRVIKVKISVPKSAQAGGYFGAIRLSPATPDEGGQVNMAPSVASIILLTVPGDVVEKLDLTNFNVKQHGNSNTLFFSPDHLQVSARFKSSGNIQVGPFGKVSVKQGDDVVYEADFNDRTPREVVLPDSARQWEIPLKNIGDIGHFTVMATFTYGEKNQTIQVEKSFWVIPYWAIAVAVVILLVVAVMVFLIVRRIRNSPRRSSHRYGHRRR